MDPPATSSKRRGVTAQRSWTGTWGWGGGVETYAR